VQKRRSQQIKSTKALVHLRLLGAFQLSVAGQNVVVTSRKARALLVYLALRRDQDIPRDTLAGLLWSERDPEQARASLRQSLSAVRKGLGAAAGALLISTNETVRLAGDLIFVDRHAFGADLADLSMDEYRALADLYQGEFLEGFTLDEPEFEYWLSAERAAMRTEITSLLSRLVGLCEDQKQIDDALAYGTRLLTIDPLQEQVQRALIRLFAAQGRYDAALHQFEQCRRELADQLNVEPERATLDLVKSIKTQRRARLSSDGLQAVGGHSAPETNSLDASPPDMPPTAIKPSIAILPFDNLSGDPEQAYFCNGITSDIITELSRFKTLFVVARNSSFAFAGGGIDLKEIGEKLGVQYLVQGSVRRAGTTVRVTAQLLEAETGNHLWAERFDRQLDDIFAVQDEVTRSIVAVLPGRVQSDVAGRAARSPTMNMKAYEYMLQGKHLRDGLNARDTAKARVVLEKALELDPNYARAYMYLADTYVIDLWLGIAQKDAAQKSLLLSRKGAGLDNNDVYIQDQLGFALLCEKQWDDAEDQFSRTLSRIVNEAESMAWCGYAFLMLGHHEKASEIVVRARKLDPLHAPTLDWILGQVHFFAGNYGEAVRALIGEALLNSLAHAFLTSAYAHLGKIDEAQNALTRFIDVRRDEVSSRNLPAAAETIEGLAGAYKGMWRNRTNWDHLAEGLRKAGLPD